MALTPKIKSYVFLFYNFPIVAYLFPDDYLSKPHFVSGCLGSRILHNRPFWFIGRKRACMEEATVLAADIQFYRTCGVRDRNRQVLLQTMDGYKAHVYIYP